MKTHNLIELWPFNRRATHTLLTFVVIVLAFIFIISLEFVFIPFFIALGLAYILNPMVNFAEKINISRRWGTFIVFTGMSFFIIIASLIVFPSIVREIRDLALGNHLFDISIEQLTQRFRDTAHAYLSPELLEKSVTLIRNWYGDLLLSQGLIQNTALAMGGRLIPGLSAILHLSLTLGLIPFYLIFLLYSLNDIWAFIHKKMVPFEYKDTFLRLSDEIHHSLSAFFRGRLAVCIIIGMISWVGFIFFDLPLPFLFGFAIGFATIVPALGLFFFLPALALFYISGAGWQDFLFISIFYTFVQSLEMFIITPIMLGKEMEIHPMVLVMSILICGSLFGVIGVILAVPIASTAKILFREFIFPSFIALSEKRGKS